MALTDTGRLRYCTLVKPRAGSPRARVGEGIGFHPDGRIASLTLDEPLKAAGLALPVGASVAWDPKGALLGGYSKDPIQAGAAGSITTFMLRDDITFTWLKVDPMFDSLRGEPRFQALMKRMQFPN